MHTHYLNNCNHELRHCSICDVVYCTLCNAEWNKKYRITWADSITYVTSDTEWQGDGVNPNFNLDESSTIKIHEHK